MSSTPVSTVRVIDPRIKPQPEPVYVVTTGPQQSQFYKTPASALSDSYVGFNNFTTLGIDRAYGTNAELNIRAKITFHNIKYASTASKPRNLSNVSTIDLENMRVTNYDWTMESFPFNKCCEQIRVNINGGALFSEPMSYIRAKERYWSQEDLNSSYANVCPCEKPAMTNECGFTVNRGESDFEKKPSRVSEFRFDFSQSSDGIRGTGNSFLVQPYTSVVVEPPDGSQASGVYPIESDEFIVEWREPVFCSPFTAKIDQVYGDALYNVTSLDVSFNMQNLSNMVRTRNKYVDRIEVHLLNVDFLYQVFTIPPGMSAPPVTYVPYRRFVPYITDYPSNPVPLLTESQLEGSATVPPVRSQRVRLTSGVYTLNTVPQAIWVFAGPTKANLQLNPDDGWDGGSSLSSPIDPRPTWSFPSMSGYTNYTKTWSYTKTFLQMQHISISMGNTTQILNTASPEELYRIAKANGCKDTYVQWHSDTYPIPSPYGASATPPGSVLRLIPGVDIVLPDQQLVPGSNANNMVLQVEAEFTITNQVPANYRDISLWLIFEEVGVAAIRPGQCDVILNPVDVSPEGEVSPAPSAVVETPTGTDMLEGSGLFDWVKKGWKALKDSGIVDKAVKFAKDKKLLSKAASMIPGVGSTVSNVVSSLGYGDRGFKRPRAYSGGRVMGFDDFM